MYCNSYDANNDDKPNDLVNSKKSRRKSSFASLPSLRGKAGKEDKQYVKAKTQGFVICEGEKSSNIDFPTSRLTYTVQVDLGGVVNSLIAEKSWVGFLSDYSDMRKYFSKDFLIDQKKRTTFLNLIHTIKNGDVEAVEYIRNINEKDELQAGLSLSQQFAEQMKKEVSQRVANSKRQTAAKTSQHI